MAIAKAVQLVKAGSSKWMHEQQVTQFEWQVGYGAFTIGGISQVAATKNDILHQEKHHARKSFARNGRHSCVDTGWLSTPTDLSRPWRDWSCRRWVPGSPCRAIFKRPWRGFQDKTS